MKPLILLLTAFAVSLIIGYLVNSQWPLIFSGNFAMCIMLVFTGAAHFKFEKGMAMMVPQFIPNKSQVVMASGIAEIILGIALLFPFVRFYAGVLLVLMFLALLPANISAAKRKVNYEKGTYDGPGPQYLWFRIPMQILLIAWVLYFSVIN
jgi:uncharacterized membrane protein